MKTSFKVNQKSQALIINQGTEPLPKPKKIVAPLVSSATVKCPKCGNETANVESGMGYITCTFCGWNF